MEALHAIELADGPGLQNAPDIWEILRDLVGDNPWLVLLISLLSWAALIYGLYKKSVEGVGRTSDLLRDLAARSDRRSLIVRFVAAALLALVSASWLILAIPWGNVLLHVVLSVVGWHDDLNWFTLSPGSIACVVYSIFAGGRSIHAYVTEKPGTWALIGLGSAVLPGIPIILIIWGPGPLWLTFSGISFILGFVVAPATIIGCVQLCGIQQLAPRRTNA
ncbi:hypothetical protein GCM10009765_41170 [Fodinicola feengrottensis]|uniref:Uncharacterized protein n=1 Tax=Fodinicola feengrottensis TaxID=435914 RepID=A0ABN2HGH6_9ACTN